MKKIKEYYGTQRPSFAGGAGAGSNFYSGRDLGTHSRGSLGSRGADSNFSRRMQALVPNDYYDLLEEEEEEFDEDVVVENSSYSLEKVLEINESLSDLTGAIFDAGLDVVGDMARATTSASTGGMSSVAFFLKNIYEIKKGRDRANETITSFLQDPTDEKVKEMGEVLDALVKDVIDLIQTLVESLPEPAIGETSSVMTSIALGVSKFIEITKVFLASPDFKSKVASNLIRRTSLYSVVKPVLKFIINLFDSEYAPERVMENRSMIMGTMKRIVLLADLIEDYILQKEVALEMGISDEDFEYKYRIIKNPGEINTYDHENPRAERTVEERIEEERREYSEDYTDPMSSMSDSYMSKNGSFLRKLFVSKPGDTGLFAESLINRSLIYLIESYDDVIDEDLEEEEDTEIEEFSAAGAVAGVSLPLGSSTKGSKGQHSSTSGGKAFPYTTQNMKNFKNYSRKTFGGK